MSGILKRLPSPAMIVACVALVVALGGVSYAAVALPKNSVGTKQIKRGAVTASKIRKNAVSSTKVKDGSLLAADFKPGQLDAAASGPAGPSGPPGPEGPAGPATGPAGGDLTGSYPNPLIKDGAVTTPKIASGAVGRAQINGDQVQDRMTFGQIRADGSIRLGTPNLTGVTHPSTGVYCLQVSGLTATEKESIVVSPHADSLPAFGGTANGSGSNAGCGSLASVVIENASGNPIDARFPFQIAGS